MPTSDTSAPTAASVPDDGVRSVPLAVLRELWDPSECWTWQSLWIGPITLADVEGAVPVDRPVESDEEPIMHLGRIRWLMEHGWTDAITVEIGDTPTSVWCWGILDGNHRVVAAILRGDERIDVELSGWLDVANQLLTPDPPW